RAGLVGGGAGADRLLSGGHADQARLGALRQGRELLALLRRRAPGGELVGEGGGDQELLRAQRETCLPATERGVLLPAGVDVAPPDRWFELSPTAAWFHIL